MTPVYTFFFKGTNWKTDGNGGWVPTNAKAKKAWSASTQAVPRSKDDVRGLVNRYGEGIDPDKRQETVGQGSLTAKQLFKEAGVRGSITWQGVKYDALDFWSAVLKAESGGDATIVNSIGCVGLMQINVPVHKQYTEEGMKEPRANIRAAKQISGNWTNPKPWEAATNGAFKKFIGQDTVIANAADSKGAGDPDTVLESAVNAGKDTVATLAGFATILFDPSTWFRAGKVLLGGIILLIVVYMAIRSAL